MRLRLPRRLRFALPLCLPCLGLVGCSYVKGAFTAMPPDFVVTSKMYAEAPKRIVVLPFAPKPGKAGRLDVTAKSAVACRDTFYRHFSVEPFEDVELSDVDRAIHMKPEPKTPRLGVAKRLATRADLIGLRSLLSLHETLWESPWAAPENHAETAKLLTTFGADAYAIGATRDYGWFYAVAFSTVTVACKMEVRSCKTGDLLWKGEWTRRSFAHALDTAIWIIPYRLVQVWQNIRGEVLENVTDRTFRDLARTIPYVRRSTRVFVRAKRYRVQLYTQPKFSAWHRLVKVRRKGLKMPLILHQPGWIHCRHPEHGECWVKAKHARLVDDDDRELALE